MLLLISSCRDLFLFVRSISSKLPLATMNVLQERGVKMENSSEEQVNIVFFLFWTSTYEFLSILLLSWVDILPWFGDSEISTFAKK